MLLATWKLSCIESVVERPKNLLNEELAARCDQCDQWTFKGT